MSTQVLHVIARMNVGGTARYVGELVEKIPGSKLATGYVQGSEIEDPSVENLAVLRVPHMGRRISLINDFRAWIELKKIIREVEPAIVHTHTFVRIDVFHQVLVVFNAVKFIFFFINKYKGNKIYRCYRLIVF